MTNEPHTEFVKATELYDADTRSATLRAFVFGSESQPDQEGGGDE